MRSATAPAPNMMKAPKTAISTAARPAIFILWTARWGRSVARLQHAKPTRVAITPPRDPDMTSVASESAARTAASAIRRALGQNFATTASVAAIPSLLREAEAALAELKELTNV